VSFQGLHNRRFIIREPRAPLRARNDPERERRASRLTAAGQSLTEYRHYALHGFLLAIAAVAILTTVAGRVAEIAPSVSRSDADPVAETSAGYLRPPVLLNTVPSVLARQQVAQAATATQVPGSAEGVVAADTPSPAATATPMPAFFTYTVQPGDTVASIAAAFGISEEYITWNNPGVASDPNLLIVGATLLIPSTNGIVYNVTVGDTLNDIASYYGIDTGAIVAFGPNGLSTPDSVVEGMVLVLPGAVPPAPPPVVVTVEEPAPDIEPAAVAVPDPEPVYEEPEYIPPPAAPSYGYVWPFYGNISTYYGYGHAGIDIDGFGAYGATIVAAASGTVVLTSWDSWGYGYHIVIQHDDGSRTLYAHLSDIWVGQGQYVGQGSAIGALGSTGYSTGPHLHFEIHIGGPVDPLAYLP
jgi:murein DD-endopeptidase MepM/ murein hydrolase activator NlpD